jgi:hypothetical protein
MELTLSLSAFLSPLSRYLKTGKAGDFPCTAKILTGATNPRHQPMVQPGRAEDLRLDIGSTAIATLSTSGVEGVERAGLYEHLQFRMPPPSALAAHTDVFLRWHSRGSSRATDHRRGSSWGSHPTESRARNARTCRKRCAIRPLHLSLISVKTHVHTAAFKSEAARSAN